MSKPEEFRRTPSASMPFVDRVKYMEQGTGPVSTSGGMKMSLTGSSECSRAAQVGSDHAPI